MTDVTARFDKVAPGGHPLVRPRDAATLILIDRSGREPKVLLGRRRLDLVFMPGKFVFPGGRVDPRDRLMSVGRALDPHTEAKLMLKMQRPSAVVSRISFTWALQTPTPMIASPSSSFMAILPLRLMLSKSARLLRRT